MNKIRFSVFETNSSSTHTITIVSKRVFEAWKNDNGYLWNDDVGGLENEEEQMKSFESSKYYDNFEDYASDNFKTFEDWENDEWYEIFIENYTTESGDEIVAFGKYGRD